MAPKRTSRGKQKREMKKIERKQDLFVAFTKRRSGIYNKAFELSTLCGASVDILMISPGGKPFCYGEPSSKSIARTSLKDENLSIEEELKKLKITELNTKIDDLLDKKNVAETQRENLKTLKSHGYWSIKDEDVESFDYDQVKKVDKSLVSITNKLISNVLSNGGEINPHAISSIGELNGVQTNHPYVFGAKNNGYKIGQAHSSPLYDSNGKGKVGIASLDPTNQAQGLYHVGEMETGNVSGVGHAPRDI